MRDLPPEFINELNKRGGLRPRTFLRFQARDRTTGGPEYLCLWTGGDNQEFTIAGRKDVFYGAGSVIELEDMTQEVGLAIRRYSLKLANLSPEVTQLLRVYDPKMAAAYIYTGLVSTESGLLITPTMLRRYKGWVDKVVIKTPPLGRQGHAKLDLVSTSRNLTRTIACRRSHENQQRRNGSDMMLKYAGATGTIEVAWGSERLSSNPPNRKRSIASAVADYSASRGGR